MRGSEKNEYYQVKNEKRTKIKKVHFLLLNFVRIIFYFSNLLLNFYLITSYYNIKLQKTSLSNQYIKKKHLKLCMVMCLFRNSLNNVKIYYYSNFKCFVVI